MAKLGNVVQLNPKNDDLNVYGTIRTYLLRKGQNSPNTKDTYERAIRDFFRTMKNKELEELVPEDLIFTKKQIEDYQVALKEQYKGATVNNAVTAIRECYKRLEDNGFPVSISWFNVERYDEHDSEKYGTLSHEEVLAILDLVSKTRKGKEKALLIRLAYATAFRKESILTMEWNQIINIDGQWYAKVLGKGNKWSHKKLTDDLYDALMAHKANTKGDKIFAITPLTVSRMMNYIRENMDFGHRRIVFHSFKKASINEVNLISGGDLKAIQAHGDHTDVKTTLNSYLEDKKMEDLIAVDINTRVPLEKLQDMSKEELVQLIMSADRSTQIKLMKKAGFM
jgi:integrase